MKGVRVSFLRVVSSLFPGPETAFEIVEFRKIELAHLVASSGAADARGAVNQVGLVLVEFGDLILKIPGVHVDIDRAGYMTGLELLCRAHVEHDVFFIGAKLFKRGDVD